MRKKVYIAYANRTPIGKFGGALSSFNASQLFLTLTNSLELSNKIEKVIVGNVLQTGMGQNIGRQIARSAFGTPCCGYTVNMVCGSGLQAINLGMQDILLNQADIVVAGGTESMSNAPYILPNARTGYKMGDQPVVDSMIRDGLWEVDGNYHMGNTAENLAKKYNISREEQDSFAAQSQQKTETAIKNNFFKDEIIPITLKKKREEIVVSQDEFPRPGVTTESLSTLKPVFQKDGTVTAGNASGINDGAALMVLASEEGLKKLGVEPFATIDAVAMAGVEPEIMGIGPAAAVTKLLNQTNQTISDFDLIEANEAFASQSIAVGKELNWDKTKVNVNGGAIALGHPIGASGTRIAVTLVHEMKRRSAKKGLATLCIGGGMGIAAAFSTC